MIAIYKIKIRNSNQKSSYILDIQADSILTAFRMAKDHARFTAGWNFEDIVLEYLTPKQIKLDDYKILGISQESLI